MNDRITLGAAVLQAVLIVAALTARWYVRPARARGRHAGGTR